MVGVILDLDDRIRRIIHLEKDGNGLHLETRSRNAPAPLVNIQPDQVNASEGLAHQLIVCRQTGGNRMAGRSPGCIKLDHRDLTQRPGFFNLGRQLFVQIAVFGP